MNETTGNHLPSPAETSGGVDGVNTVNTVKSSKKNLNTRVIVAVIACLIGVGIAGKLEAGSDDPATVTSSVEATSARAKTPTVSPTFNAPIPMAVRSSTEQDFLQNLDNFGIYGLGEDRAVAMAGAVCLVLVDHPEWGPARIAAEVQSAAPTLTLKQGAYFAGAAMKSYCPDEYHRLAAQN